MTVVCATDLSPCSLTATRLAAALARRRGEAMILLHAIEPLAIDPLGATLGSAAWEQERLPIARAEL